MSVLCTVPSITRASYTGPTVLPVPWQSRVRNLKSSKDQRWACSCFVFACELANEPPVPRPVRLRLEVDGEFASCSSIRPSCLANAPPPGDTIVFALSHCIRLRTRCGEELTTVAPSREALVVDFGRRPQFHACHPCWVMLLAFSIDHSSVSQRSGRSHQARYFRSGDGAKDTCMRSHRSPSPRLVKKVFIITLFIPIKKSNEYETCRLFVQQIVLAVVRWVDFKIP